MKKVLFIILFAPLLGWAQQLKVDSIPSELEKRIMILENVVYVQKHEVSRLSLANKELDSRISTAAYRIDASGSWIIVGLVVGALGTAGSYALFNTRDPQAFLIGASISSGFSLLSIGVAGGKLISASRRLDPSLAIHDY